jgi:hypothetical protein
VSEQQLRADLFELGQLALATGHEPARVAAHVEQIRRDAEVLLDDPALGELALRVVDACDAMLPRRSPRVGPAPEGELEHALTVGLSCGEGRWIWRFPESREQLIQEWREGYLPVHLTPARPPMRGILGTLRAVDELPEVDLRATLSAQACTLHLPEGDVVWSLEEAPDPPAAP